MANETFFSDTATDPSHMPIAERETWHREAWQAEQFELSTLVGVRQYTSESIEPDVYEAIYGIEAPWAAKWAERQS